MTDIWQLPLVQYGFAGITAVLLAFLFWMVKKLIGLLEANQKIIEANTTAHVQVMGTSKQQLELAKEQMKLTIAIKDMLLAKPCIAKDQ